MKYDLGNLLSMFNESLEKLIRHLEEGFPDRALIRAREMHKAIEKLKCYTVDQTYTEKRL